MRILFLSQLVPWPAPLIGGQLRTARLVEELSSACDVTLVCCQSPYHAPSPTDWSFASRLESISTVPIEVPERSRDPLWGNGRAMLGGLLPTRVPAFIKARISSALVDHLSRLPGTFSAIWAGRSWTAEAARLARKEPVLVDIDDFESILLRQDVARLGHYRRRVFHQSQVRQVSRYEARLPGRFAGVAVTKQEDLALLDVRYRHRAHLVPNGVDLPARVERSPLDGRLLFVGSFGHPPNLDGMTWFCDEVLPLIRRSRADTTVDIVGRGPITAEWNRIKAIQGVSFIESPMELGGFYSRAAAVIAPIRVGHGTKLKTLEALAHRVPLIATTEATTGLPLVANKHCLVADTPEQFAAHCVSALNDRRGHSDMVEAASVVAESFTWKHVGERALRALTELGA